MTARERGKCECSLMAKLELPKLASWVRFPSLAPKRDVSRRRVFSVRKRLPRKQMLFAYRFDGKASDDVGGKRN